MKNRTLITIILIILFLALIKVLFLKKENSSAPPPAKGGAVSFVTVFIAKPSVLENKIYSTGSILANEEVELHSELPGKITRLNFSEGKSVKKGDLLVKINDAELSAQLKKAMLESQLADQKAERYKRMREIQGISQEEYDIILNQAGTLKADIEYIHAQIAKSEIRAPFDGIIGLKNISEGSFISPAEVIATLQQTDPVKIDFSVPERYAERINPAEGLTFTTEGVKDTFNAKIFAIEPKIDPSTRTVKIRAICSNKDGKIIPGSFAKINLALEEVKNALMIPTEAIIPELKGQKVFLYKSGKAIPQKVQTGLRTDTNVQITEGLTPGDTVITTGLMQLKPEAPVKIVNQ